MSALDRIIALYARQRELQDRAGDFGALSADEQAELSYIPTLLAKLWERRRCEMAGIATIEIEPAPRKNKWNSARLPTYHEKEAAERAA